MNKQREEDRQGILFYLQSARESLLCSIHTITLRGERVEIFYFHVAFANILKKREKDDHLHSYNQPSFLPVVCPRHTCVQFPSILLQRPIKPSTCNSRRTEEEERSDIPRRTNAVKSNARYVLTHSNEKRKM